MSIKIGDKIPSVSLKYMDKDGMQTVKTDEFFKGKKVVLFALPGAFTPTCSAKHLPGFVQHAESIRKKGVDAIACVSVNDAFVMDAWGKSQNAGENVMMLADGNAELTKAMGLEMDGSGFGMGTRMQRFAMVVDNGTVSQLYIEQPRAFEVSSADHVLKNL